MSSSVVHARLPAKVLTGWTSWCPPGLRTCSGMVAFLILQGLEPSPEPDSNNEDSQ